MGRDTRASHVARVAIATVALLATTISPATSQVATGNDVTNADRVLLAQERTRQRPGAPEGDRRRPSPANDLLRERLTNPQPVEPGKTLQLERLGTSFVLPPGATWGTEALSQGDLIVRIAPLEPAIAVAITHNPDEQYCDRHLWTVATQPTDLRNDAAGWLPREWFSQVVTLYYRRAEVINACLPVRAGIVAARITVRPMHLVNEETKASVRALLQAAAAPLQTVGAAAKGRIQLSVLGLSVAMPPSASWVASVTQSSTGSRDLLSRQQPAQPPVSVELARHVEHSDCGALILDLPGSFSPLPEGQATEAWIPKSWTRMVLADGDQRLMCIATPKGVVTALARSTAEWAAADVATVKDLLLQTTALLLESR